MTDFTDDDFLGQTAAAPTPVAAPEQAAAPAPAPAASTEAPAADATTPAAETPKPKMAQRKSVYLNRFTLRAPPVVDGAREAEFFIEVNDGNVHMNVRNHVPEEQEMNWGRVKARIGLIVFSAWAEIALEFIASGTKGKQKMDNFSHYSGGKYNEQMGKENDLIWGKDDNGVFYISVHEEGRKPVRFDFLPNKWHHFVKGDGQPFDQAEMSKMFFKGWLITLRQTITTVVANGACASVFLNYDENKEGPHGNSPDAAPPAGAGGNDKQYGGGFQKRQWNGGGQGGGGGGGGWQNRGGGGGGGGQWQKKPWQGGQGGGGGGWQNRQGGGGGGGGWQNRGGGQGGGGGGQWQNRNQGGGQQGGGGGGYGQQKAVDNMAPGDIQF